MLFVIGHIYTTIIPPFQAPDEFEHVKRAYMLSQGQLWLHSVDGSPSGGYIDNGLMTYMRQFFPFKGDATRKISQDVILNSNTMNWSGTSEFDVSAVTAYYFPALYAPHAVGLLVGKNLGLSVSLSYRLGRYLSMTTCTLILFFAFRVFPPPPLVLALLALPMSLFLFSSAVLDGMATATAVLAFSAFMRIATDRKAAPTFTLPILIISIVLITSCRANTLPFLFLPFAAYWFLRSRGSLIAAIIASLLVCAWTIYTVKFTVYPPGPLKINHMERLLSYVLHPMNFAKILLATLSDKATTSFYAVSFLGVLGWLDTPLPAHIYHFLAIILAAILICSFSLRTITEQWLTRSLIVFCTVCALLMTFLALLVQWTVEPATVILGVQGRYFAIPAIALAYAVTGGHPIASSKLRQRLALGLTIVLLGISVYSTVSALVARYYMIPTQVADFNVAMKPTPALTRGKPVSLHFSPVQTNTPAGLDKLGVMFGTYMRPHEGKAELRLWTNDGRYITIPFELPSLVDNEYKVFLLDGKPYIGGEIVSQGGEGISVWESHIGDNLVVSCMAIETHVGHILTTPGCPLPQP